MVNVDAESGYHQVSIDPRYRYTTHKLDDAVTRSRRHALNDTLDSAANWTTQSAAERARTDKVYELSERIATQFVTFVSVTHADMFLVVRSVRNRLVMMLPNTAHQLKVSRFYVVLAGVANTSYGIVYFRQDQPHIDLFVFFSVFFSCFFLFLAGCVLLWKAKQAVDRQRSRHRRQIEMHDMASRPFASALVYWPDHPRLLSKSDHPRPVPQSDHQSRPPPQDDAGAGLRLSPVAVEPTRSAVAVVATFMVELPCRSSAPVRACLGSCLLTPRSLLTSAGMTHHVTVKQSTCTGARPRTSVTWPTTSTTTTTTSTVANALF